MLTQVELYRKRLNYTTKRNLVNKDKTQPYLWVEVRVGATYFDEQSQKDLASLLQPDVELIQNPDSIYLMKDVFRMVVSNLGDIEA